MFKKMLVIMVLNAVLIFATVAVYAGHGPQQGGSIQGPQQGGFIQNYLLGLDYADISEQEAEDLFYMIQEEKLARDVYLYLADTWGLGIFFNIARAEDMHIQAVQALLDKYEMGQGIEDDTPGVFASQEFQDTYDALIVLGSTSLEQALSTGAGTEDLDLADLESRILNTDNEDIQALYQNLMKGSRNHLRAFCSMLEIYSENEYAAQYITQDELEEILASSMERALYNAEGEPITGPASPNCKGRGDFRGQGQGRGVGNCNCTAGIDCPFIN